MLDVASLGLLDVAAPFVLAIEFDGLDWGTKKDDCTKQSDIAQPLACDFLSRIVDWEMYESRFFLARSCQNFQVRKTELYSPKNSDIS